jgi:hypothetical protein
MRFRTLEALELHKLILEIYTTQYCGVIIHSNGFSDRIILQYEGNNIDNLLVIVLCMTRSFDKKRLIALIILISSNRLKGM